MFAINALIRPPLRCPDRTSPKNYKDVADGKVKYYTTSQLAKRWGVSSATVIRLIEQGDLTGLKIRGSYRVGVGSVQEYEVRVAF